MTYSLEINRPKPEDAQRADRKSQTITYTYDQLNRLTQKAYPDSTAVNYTYDNDSRLTQVTDPTGTYSFTFDNTGRLTGATSQYTFLTGRNFATGYSYDAALNRTGFTDPESGSTSYGYDTLNRLQTLTPPSAFTSGNFGFSYDALSRRTQMTRPNSITTSYGYDNLSRLLSVLHKTGTTTLDGAIYTVDNAGNRSSKADQLAGITSNYTYDPIYELTQVTQGTSTTESYSYDAVGNRTASLGVSSYTNNTSNELTSTSNASYTYDSNGNTLTKVAGSNTTSFAWDFENRLSSVTLPGTGGTVTFKYDPFGRRIYKSSNSGTSIFAYDGYNLVEEANASGTVVARYTQTRYADEPLAMLRGGATNYYHQDGINSVTSLSNAAGVLVQTYAFDSFGKQTSSSGSLTNPFQYTAREFDSETSLYYYRARYYDSQSSGRFVDEDPLQFGTGQINLYTYVGNSPTNWIDPTGYIHQGPDGKLHDDPAGGLEVLCRNNRNKAHDIKMLKQSILVRTAELESFGEDADQGHPDRLAAEEATLARCSECEKEKPEPRDVPVVAPEWKKWLERNRTPILVTGAVAVTVGAVALALFTGGQSLWGLAWAF